MLPQHEMPRHETRHIRTIVGDNVKAAREAAGLTQRQLAERLDIDAMSVSRWERGVVLPSVESVASLAQVLERADGWFYVDHDYDESSPSSGKAAA